MMIRAVPPFGMLIASLVLAGGCATASLDGQQTVAGAAQSAISGRGNVTVNWLDDRSALLTGWVQDSLSKQAVVRAVQRHPDVDEVLSLITETPHGD